MNNSVKNGLLTGTVLIVAYCVVWQVKPAANFSLSFYFIQSTIIYLIFMLRTTRQQSVVDSGEYGFGEALISAMGTYAIGSFIVTVFTLVILHLVPSQLELAKEAGLETMEWMASLSGTNEDALLDQMDMSMEAMEEGAMDIGSNLLNWGVSLFFPGSLYGVIAAIFRRK